MKKLARWFSLTLVAACGSTTPGARPHDMSAAQHEREADQHAHAADEHADHYDPHASTATTTCSLKSASWTSTATFRAVPGMTVEWLQRVVDCHLARNAVLGHVAPEMPNCPLVPEGVTARVRSTGNGFAVDLRADDSTTVREIVARTDRLARRP